MSTTSARLIASLLLAALPLGAVAQTSSAYTPPALIKAGTNTTPITTPGSVTIQVFVKKDGTFTVNHVISSTNPADNAAALEIAKTATYKPAMRDGQPVDGFFDYSLNLRGGTTLAPTPAGSGPTAQAYALIRSGKYAEAKSQLSDYLQSHPGDVQASTLLGVADAFAGDSDGAAAAFDSVPSIPEQYHTLALQAYTKHAANLLEAQKYPEAVTAATRVIALDPQSVDGYNVRGLAAADQQQYKAAIPDLQKALDLLKAGKPDEKSLLNLESNLTYAHLNAGEYDAAAALAKDVVRLDPLQAPKLQQAELVAVSNDGIGLANAGKIPEAVTAFETGSTTFPANAANYYALAAFVMLNAKAPDYKKIKAEADKSLALDGSNGRALFVNAFVAANANDSKTAIADLNKAKASTLYGTDASFAKQVDDNLKKLTAAGS